MMTQWRKSMAVFKFFLPVSAFCTVLLYLAGCTVNPATGQQQFTALMSPAQEVQVGAQEHEKIAAMFAVDKADPSLQSYVQEIGNRLAANTERGDVTYRFYILDDAMVNAFAVPGGYIYVSRGLMAQANSEAELAGVIAHEIGHITGRHSAERYSQGMLTSLGAVVLSAALNSSTASQVAGLGSELYMRSYSRSQEHEADMLGVRYLSQAGYDPQGMAAFLANLEQHSAFEESLAGRGRQAQSFNYFSTHPLTSDRVTRTRAQAETSGAQDGHVGRDEYLRRLDGMIYGDSPRQGYARGTSFYHPEMDFTFTVPDGFRLINQPHQVVATDQPGTTIIVFDAAPNDRRVDAYRYMTEIWMQGEALSQAERIEINGRAAATASFPGKVNGQNVTIRIVAVEWAPNSFFRFQMAYPQGAGNTLVERLRQTTYSLRTMNEREKREIQPYRVRIVEARAGDTVASLARQMPFDSHQQERFRALNNMRAGEPLLQGRLYKTVSTR